MSKTWKKFDGWRDGGKEAKRTANQTVRRYKGELPDGGAYKKLYDGWSICDWNCTRSPAEQSYRFHNPHIDPWCICSEPYRSTRLIDCEAPEAVRDGYTFILPPGYHFSRRWRAPEQRVNPDTGAYEIKIRKHRWVWKHETVYADYQWSYETQAMRHEHCRYKDMDWRSEWYEEWVPNPWPEVMKEVSTPYFTDHDVRRWAEHREEDTRNFRYRKHWPRYHRRDRRVARKLKASADL